MASSLTPCPSPSRVSNVAYTLRTLLAVGAVLCVAMAAHAESSSPANGSSNKSQAQSGQPAAPEERLSFGERESRMEHLVEQMHQQTAAMEKIAVQARKEKDIVKLDCVNAKVNQVKGLVKISEQAAADLHEANARQDDDTSQNHFTKATMAGRKVSQLRQDAEQCIGQLAYYTDDKTHVDVEVPPGLPSTDSTYAPAPTTIDNRPAPASGF